MPWVSSVEYFLYNNCWCWSMDLHCCIVNEIGDLASYKFGLLCHWLPLIVFIIAWFIDTEEYQHLSQLWCLGYHGCRIVVGSTVAHCSGQWSHILVLLLAALLRSCDCLVGTCPVNGNYTPVLAKRFLHLLHFHTLFSFSGVAPSYIHVGFVLCPKLLSPKFVY